MDILNNLVFIAAVTLPVAHQSPMPLVYLRSIIAIWALPWAKTLIIDYHFPDQVGRYRVIDTLLTWKEWGR